MILLKFTTLTKILKAKNFFLQIPRYNSFRQNFETIYGPVNMTSWFPRHMYRGMMELQAKLAVVDCIIEVHDARIPFSGRNPKFCSALTAIRPHILVLNKCDLSDSSHNDEIKRYYERQNINHVLFTNCKENKQGIQKIVPLAVDLIKNSDLYNRGNSGSFLIMVIGVPNVGKSSLINRLRNYNLKRKKATAVGAIPGVTKSVLERIKIYDNPTIYLFDSPGIMQPNVDNLEIGLKLALCRIIMDSVVGIELIADYLLYWLNKHKNFSYVEYLNLQKPTDDIRYLLMQTAINHNKIRRVNNATGSLVTVPDIEASASHFVRAFREGKFGKVLLDIDNFINIRN